jgi:hypothetical protein
MNHKALREIARSDKWQSLYARAKELSSIRLFNNTIDFTKIQIWFMYYLEMYQSLYIDLNSGERMISEDVIKDDLRAEAYITYKNEERKKRNRGEDIEKNKLTSTGGLPSVRFVRKK